MKERIAGGYALVGKSYISSLKAQISSKRLTANEGRGSLAWLEMSSIRKAAEALRGNNKNSRKAEKITPKYTASELVKLTSLPLRVACKIFKSVSASEPLSSNTKKEKFIPLPRRLIRFLAKCEKRSTILVLLTYLERGLSLDKGRIKCAGTAKASLIARETGLTVRSVRAARAELLRLNIITPDTTKYQRKLNRDGAYFTINLNWEEGGKQAKVGSSKLSVDSTQISPLPPKKCTQISPPYRNKLSSKA